MINTDFSSSYKAAAALSKANTDAGTAQKRISTSQKINSAQDDPAGYARATKLKSYIGSYSKAIDNINSGVTLVQSVDNSMGQISEMLTKMRELAVQAAGESNTTTLATYQTTFSSYLTDLSNVVTQTTYNGSSVMDGTTTSVDVQTGIDSGSTKTLTFSDMSSASTGLNISTIDLSTDASGAISTLDTAITTATSYMTTIGAYEDSLSFSSDLNSQNILNKQSEYGNLMNADLAKEATNLAAAQIRQSSAAAMVAQGNLMNRELVGYLLRAYTG